MIYGIDGELFLELGFEVVFLIEDVFFFIRSIKLRCFNYVKEDMLKELNRYFSFDKIVVIKLILGSEINGKREFGLVDLKNFEKDYK